MDQAIVDFVLRGEGVSIREIAAHIERTPRATRTRLGRLVDLGLVVEIGSGPRDPRKVFHAAR